MGTADVIPLRVPNGYQEIVDFYGDPKVARSPAGWTVDQAWEDTNCVLIDHPLLVGATPHGKLYVHRNAAGPILRVLDRWKARMDAGHPWRLLHIACFSPRAMAASNGLLASTHTWAIAFDANPEQNALIVHIDPDDPRRKTNKEIPDEFIADAKAEGFVWGGDFHNRFDPMHFQLCSGY